VHSSYSSGRRWQPRKREEDEGWSGRLRPFPSLLPPKFLWRDERRATLFGVAVSSMTALEDSDPFPIVVEELICGEVVTKKRDVMAEVPARIPMGNFFLACRGLLGLLSYLTGARFFLRCATSAYGQCPKKRDFLSPSSPLATLSLLP